MGASVDSPIRMPPKWRSAMGISPDVSLAGAREGRGEARRLLSQELDPGEHRKVQRTAKAHRATNSFEAVAREWLAKYSPRWAASHSEKVIKRLGNHVFPWIGGRPIADIAPPEVLKVLKRIEGRGAHDTAHRALQNCGQVFRYGVTTGRILSDPCRDLRGALRPMASADSANHAVCHDGMRLVGPYNWRDPRCGARQQDMDMMFRVQQRMMMVVAQQRRAALR